MQDELARLTAKLAEAEGDLARLRAVGEKQAVWCDETAAWIKSVKPQHGNIAQNALVMGKALRAALAAPQDSANPPTPQPRPEHVVKVEAMREVADRMDRCVTAHVDPYAEGMKLAIDGIRSIATEMDRCIAKHILTPIDEAEKGGA